jgi:hypothetical protein
MSLNDIKYNPDHKISNKRNVRLNHTWAFKRPRYTSNQTFMPDDQYPNLELMNKNSNYQSALNFGKYKIFDYYSYITDKKNEFCSVRNYVLDRKSFTKILGDILKLLTKESDFDFKVEEQYGNINESIFITKSLAAISISQDFNKSSLEIFASEAYFTKFGKFFAKLADKYAIVINNEPIKNNIYFMMEKRGEIVLEPFELPVLNIDINKQYNDDFTKVSNEIIQILNSTKSGLHLIYGEPGNGKTTYVQYLTNHINKKIVFIPPSMFQTLQTPQFLDFLYINRGCVLIIEDSESLLKDRNQESNVNCSFLLNITDGFISKILNMQVICSFNCDIGLIDKALLRKGRLLNAYEFKKLTPEKSSILLSENGHPDVDVKDGMSLAEIFNYDPNTTEKNVNKTRKTIGFHNE